MSPTCAPGAAWPAAMIADAEAPLTAGTERYMRAAAHAVAVAALDELRSRRGGAVGARVLVLVGGGHNGADALLAAAALARRGCAVTAVPATDRPLATAVQEARSAGVRMASADPAAPAGGSAARPADPADPAAAAVRAFLDAGGDLVLDGLTGIGAAGALRPRAAALIAPLLRPGEDRAGTRAPRPFRVLAVDLPSGTGVDDARLPGPVLPADRTVTFTCLKAALCLPPACHLAGRVEVIDLGLPLPGGAPIATRPDPARTAAALRAPGTHDHKYTRGVVGLWAGSEPYPGAALLAASGAARAGAGMVRLCAPRRVEDLVLAARPEVVAVPGRCQALVVGPGTDPADGSRAEELLAILRACPVDRAPRDEARPGGPGAAGGGSRGGGPRGQGAWAGPSTGAPIARPGTPVVIDAGALSLLGGLLAGRHGGQEGSPPRADVAREPHAEGREHFPISGRAGRGAQEEGAGWEQRRRRSARCRPEHVLTPHAGEAAALLGALGQDWNRERVEAHPPSAATALSEATGATVLLKGAPTLIASPGQPLCAVDGGPGWLATAGSGDVLAGILGALLAGAAVGWERRGAPPRAGEVVPVVAAAVRLHALAGDLASERPEGPAPIVAMDIADAIPRAWGALAPGPH